MSKHRRPQGFQRTDRIGDFIQRELATLIQFQMKDPRLGMVTIQEVRVSRDISYADVYFNLLGEGAEAGEEAEQVLQHAAGFLRSALAKQLNTRTTPRLRFHYDKLPEQASHISRLIDRAISEDHRDDHGDEEPSNEQN